MTLKQVAAKMKASEAMKNSNKDEDFRGQKCINNLGKNEKCKERKRASETNNKNRKMAV